MTERWKVRKRKRSFIHWFILQMAVTARAGPSQRQEHRTPSSLPCGAREHLCHLQLLSRHISRKLDQEQSGQKRNCRSEGIASSSFTPCTTMLVPQPVSSWCLSKFFGFLPLQASLKDTFLRIHLFLEVSVLSSRVG